MPTFSELIHLSNSIDTAQAYLMNLAEKHGGEVTLTIKNEAPFVTVFLGKGSEAPIGFGSSVAAALANAVENNEDLKKEFSQWRSNQE